jgi:quinol monooxygenase YgiN
MIMIHVIATIKVRPGTRQKYLGILKANLPNVLAEKGCIAYVPAVDAESGIPVQVDLRADVVTLIEAWESLADLQAHLKAPHMLAYRETVKDIVKNISLHVMMPA